MITLEKHGKLIAAMLCLITAAPITSTVLAMEKDIQTDWVGDKPSAHRAELVVKSNIEDDIRERVSSVGTDLIQEENNNKEVEMQKEENINYSLAQNLTNTSEKPVEISKPEPQLKPEPKPEPKPVPTPQPSIDLNNRIAEAAKGLVGITDGWWCTNVATQALVNAGVSASVMWPDQYIQYGYYVDAANAQPGNLIFYNNGGRGIDHIAIYIGNGMAVHGNYLGRTVIASAYLPGAGIPQFIQIQ